MGSTEEIRKAITEALEEIRKHVGLKAAAQVELDKHDSLLKKANAHYLSLCADLCVSFVADEESKPASASSSAPSPQDHWALTAPLTRDRIIGHAIDKRALGWTWDEVAGSVGISRRALAEIIDAAGVDQSLLRRNTERSVLLEKRKEQQKKALQMMDSGCSIQKIAKTIGVSVHNVSCFFNTGEWSHPLR